MITVNATSPGSGIACGGCDVVESANAKTAQDVLLERYYPSRKKERLQKGWNLITTTVFFFFLLSSARF